VLRAGIRRALTAGERDEALRLRSEVGRRGGRRQDLRDRRWADNGNPDAAVDVFDPASETWSRLDGVTNPAPAAAGTAVAGGKIYLVGGCTDGAPGARSTSTQNDQLRRAEAVGVRRESSRLTCHKRYIELTT